MKKIISLLLVAVMLCGFAVPAMAGSFNPESSRSQIPVIRILGDGEPLYDAEGNKIFHLRTSLTESSDDAEEDEDDDSIMESVANVMLPFLIDGLLNDEWDAYYENLEKELTDITGSARLDKNGNPAEGTGISAARKAFVERARKTDKKYEKGEKVSKGYYGLYDYHFWYDWRLDPLYTADLLHQYILDIKEVTGCDKVAINASCLGTIMTTAYVAKYGVEHINGIGYTGSLANGAEFMSEAISGKFDVNSESLQRILMDSAYLGLFDLDEFVDKSLELVLATGLVDFLEADIRKNIYNKVVKGVTSALALSTIFTYPSYWAAVSAEDFDDALVYVFGENHDDPDHEYAGLIAKIKKYDELVRQNFSDIILSISEGGAHFGAIAKYGFQILPICQSYDAVSDQFVSVKRASFGAKTSTIYDTLSENYISSRIELGFGKHISPDKQIDASTCLYPNSTWFVKNSSHSEYSPQEKKILYDVSTADRQLTVDDFEWSQFMVYDYETEIMEKMTEDNCNTEQWETKEKDPSPALFFIRLLRVFIEWLTMLVQRFF